MVGIGRGIALPVFLFQNAKALIGFVRRFAEEFAVE